MGENSPDELITFVGTGDYHRATYIFEDGRTYSTQYVPAALVYLLKPKSVFVLMTEEAREDHWASLRGEIKVAAKTEDMSIETIDIPLGIDRDQLWGIFSTFTRKDVIKNGDHVIFDITHSLRYLPFLVFLSIAFLRVTRQIYVDGVYYGAYEVQDARLRRPILDLTPLISLLDWIIATEKFLESGRASEFTKLLEEDTVGESLLDLAECLQRITQPYRLNRPRDLTNAAKGLDQLLDTVECEATTETSPFLELVDRIRDEYLSLALPKPESEDAIKDYLAVELELINRYVAREQYTQAIILSQEWVISLVTWKLGRSISNWRAREDSKSVLYMHCDSEYIPLRSVARELKEVDCYHQIAALWEKSSFGLPGLRNSVAHAGEARSRKMPDSWQIADAVKKLPSRLDTAAPDVAKRRRELFR